MDENTKSDVEILNDLSLICKDGEKFYNETVSKVENPALAAVFTDMATIREKFQIDINTLILSMGGEPNDKDCSLTGTFHQKYADLRAMISSDSDHAYISQLEELEDRTLDEFQEALDNVKSLKIKEFVQIALLKFKKTHDEMKALQLATAS